MGDYITELRDTVRQSAGHLATVTPEAAARRPDSGGWSAKEIIGHLVDSASNNHQRFVRAQLKDDLVFPGYEQDGWVAAQCYQDAPWPDLVVLWREFNLHIARVMEAVPASIRYRETREHNFYDIASNGVPAGEPSTLDYFMADYVWHLKHHLEQIRRLGLLLCLTLFLAIGGAGAAHGQGVPASVIAPSWVEPFKPFRIIGNVYFVGTRGLACFLITSPEGHILIDTGLEQSAPLVLASVEKLGFKPKDIRIILSSHAHFDHVAGHALVKAATGAQVFASDADAVLLESGGKADFRFRNDISFTPVTVDRRLKNGETVTLGKSVLTAHLTPGHTKGNTTWTMTVQDSGKSYQVVLTGSMTINPGVKMLNYAPYPASGADYAKSFEFLESLHPDIFFAPHGGQFNLEAKVRRMEQDAAVNPFIDPQGYRDRIATWKKLYLAQLESERPKP